MWILKYCSIRVDLNYSFQHISPFLWVVNPNELSKVLYVHIPVVKDLRGWCYYLCMVSSLLFPHDIISIIPYRPSYHKYLFILLCCITFTTQSSTIMIVCMSNECPKCCQHNTATGHISSVWSDVSACRLQTRHLISTSTLLIRNLSLEGEHSRTTLHIKCFTFRAIFKF